MTGSGTIPKKRAGERVGRNDLAFADVLRLRHLFELAVEFRSTLLIELPEEEPAREVVV